MNYAYYNTSLCPVEISYEKDIIKGIRILQDKIKDVGRRTDFTDKIFYNLEEYFNGRKKDILLEYELSGTEFQVKVWSAILQIPYGETRSYKEIADKINHPKSYRAVGSACNKNPIPFIVPCHRVIGSDGSMVGYGGGISIKEKLIRLEKTNE